LIRAYGRLASIASAQQQRDCEAAERANANVVTLRRDDVSGVTTPLADAKPAWAAGDVRPTEHTTALR
jgi:hypothetical protein